MVDVLTLEQLDGLLESAGYHQEPLRVTADFLCQVRRIPAPVMRVSADPPLPIGTDVHVVWDGSENIRLVDGEWTFIPSPKVIKRGWIDGEYHGSAVRRLVDRGPIRAAVDDYWPVQPGS